MDFENDLPKSELESLRDKLQPKVLLWCEYFLQHFNKKQASRDTGVAESNAGKYADRIYNLPDVRKYIRAAIEDQIGDPGENVRFIKSIRETNLSDYMTEVKYVTSDTMIVPLSEVVEKLEKELAFELEYYVDWLNTRLEKTRSIQKMDALKDQIGRLSLELKHFPDATRIINGPQYLATDVKLDLKKIVKDKRKGIIKSVKHTKDGVQVEMYNAQDAANTLARIQGSFEKDNDQLRPVINNNLSRERVQEIAKKLEKDV